MNGDTCILVGRGPSADALTWPAPHPVMAVSSGIFKVPQQHPPAHLATLDTVKYYMAGLWPDAGSKSWAHDENVMPWPFWSDATICKHVLSGNAAKHGIYRTLPRELIDHIPPKYRDAFTRELTSNPHLFGFQPKWGDYSNVQGWQVDRTYPPNFDQDVSDPILGLDNISCPNSLLFAVQVAHQLGYRRLIFAGCDLWEEHHKEARTKLVEWWTIARSLGLRWTCLTEGSFLAGTLGAEEHVHAA
jgi:hypothetical protein